MFVYRGSTALITGASKGLGKVFAQTLAARGMNLVLVARSGDALHALAQDLTARHGVQCVPLNADLANPCAAIQIGEELERRGIQVDLLVNNAGLGLTGSFLSQDFKKVQSEIQVNVQALVALAHQLGSAMTKRGKGGIINLASNASFQPLPYMGTYAATKAFVLFFSEALQYELAGTGVHVMAACPGPTATSFFDGVSTEVSPKDMDSSESVVQKSSWFASRQWPLEKWGCKAESTRIRVQPCIRRRDSELRATRDQCNLGGRGPARDVRRPDCQFRSWI
ncbi:dehydrogenase [Cupriavidus basilensis OR16]|uniref:Dehydrogenase n=1 Tax=Cupriavidus basilensis OR16 TaxID=1127483 RepID=H1S443_9BURK|nr:SDR family oxidoreductase [Cupriavidus basilensis]EHP42682.1 dehydrogenase [Cupriavidus basilensis OR16]